MNVGWLVAVGVGAVADSFGAWHWVPLPFQSFVLLLLLFVVDQAGWILVYSVPGMFCVHFYVGIKPLVINIIVMLDFMARVDTKWVLFWIYTCDIIWFLWTQIKH